MKPLLLSLGLVAGAALAQSRVDSYTQANVSCSWIEVLPLPDGGAKASAVGIATSDDGGAQLQLSAQVELTGARQTSALNMLQGPCVKALLNASQIADGGPL